MSWCLVRLSTGALSGGLHANPLEMAIQSAVACSEVKDDGLLVSWQLVECLRVQSAVFVMRLVHRLSGRCCWLLDVPVTWWCISGTELLILFIVLPH